MKTWKTNWELKSLNFEELSDIITKVIVKQLAVEPSEVSLNVEFSKDYESDSVDTVSMLLYLEDIFKNTSSTTRTVVPTNKLEEIIFVEDLFDTIYGVLLSLEAKMNPFTAIVPDLTALEKRRKGVVVGN